MLPGGRTVAVTVDDLMVRVWDLTTGAPVGDPLTRPMGRVTTVATAVLPGGRLLAVTGSWDTVRVWDLAAGTLIGDPLPALDRVNSIAVAPTGDGICVVIVSIGIATVDFVSDP